MAVGLADIFAAVRLKLDTPGFEAEAAAAGDKAGRSAGDKMAERLNDQLKTRLKATLATGLAVGFAAITKQGLELNETLTEVQARSGAVGAEWDAMSASIQKQNRRTTLSLQEIGDGVAALKTDLGVTSDEIDIASDKLTNFGLVAKEVFADSVRGADDLKDAFDLTLLEVFTVLDALVASQQTYGGVITENRAALVALAPALTAANLGWAEGIELINLANASGIDAAAIVTAMTKALGKVKSPAELRTLIADIQATNDDFARTEKSIDLFGAKAGPKLALALAPGKGALEDYGFTAEETAGRVDKAAEQINSSWSRRLELFKENMTGFLASIGNATGPVLSIVGSLGSALGGVAAVAPGALSGLMGKLGLARGQSPAAPMFVSDVSGGGLAGAGGKGGALGTIAKFAAALGLATVALELWQSHLVPLQEANAEQTRNIDQAVREGLTSVSAEQLRVQQAALKTGLEKIFGLTAGLPGPLRDLLYGGQIKTLTADLEAVTAELHRRGPSGAPRGFTGPEVLGPPAPGTEEANATLASIDATLTATQRQVHNDLVKATDTIRTSNDPKEIASAIASVIRAVLAGAGGAKETRALVAELTAKRDAALRAGDRATAALFTNAIRQIEPFAKGRQWQQEQLTEARKVAASNMATADKVAALRGIQADLLAHQRTMAAGIVGKLIDVERAVKNIKVGAVAAGQGGGALPRQDRPGYKPPSSSPPGAPVSSYRPGAKRPAEFAAGGFFRPREPMIVGELRPELLIPDVGGQIIPRVPADSGAGNSYTVNVEGLLRARDPFEIATQLRRVAEFGVLTPRMEPS